MPLTRFFRILLQLLLLIALLPWTAAPALAVNCSDPPYYGVIDGNLVSAPDQIQIDTDCTIRNFPSPNVLGTNFSFYTQPGGNQDRWLVVFDNVVHTGNMSCNNVLGHRIWFTNGSSTTIQEGCQNLLIPVEKIDKRNPAGQSTATVGVPFTYKLTMPVLFDPGTGTVINSSGSLNTLHGITLTDDLNATGVDLTYLSHAAYLQGAGTPIAHSFANVGGVLTFSNFPVITAGDQIIVEVTAVLADTPTNVPGRQFVNTAKWEFGRLIDGVFYQPLPGEWGVTLPMTIAAPDLVVTKSGPATMGSTINLGEWGEFTIEARNAGDSDAWSAILLDRLPDGATGGMCDMQPQVRSVRVTDGVASRTLNGNDYAVSYAGAPACELSLTMAEDAGPIRPGERLIVEYRTKLDADSENGATLTNVAGATRWFNGDSSHAGRLTFTRTLTDGTVGTSDHQDAHTVAVALSGYFFEKTVVNLTSGQRPAIFAAPGDRLRYTLRLQTTADGLDNFTFYDELDALNATAAFVPGSLTLIGALPAGAVNTSNPYGGAKGTGLVSIGNLSLPAASQLLIQFDIVVAATAADGSLVANQSQLLVNGAPYTLSDDPTVNGQADPYLADDEDRTEVEIYLPVPPVPPQKSILPAKSEATIGEEVTYRITVPGTPARVALEGVVVSDDLDPSLLFTAATAAYAASGAPLPLSTTQAGQLLTWNLGTIPAGEQVVITVTTRVADHAAVAAGATFTNVASYSYAGGSSGMGPATPAITVIEPVLIPTKSVTPAPPATPTVGDVLTYTITLPVESGVDRSSAFDLSAIDTLSIGLRYRPGTARINSTATADPVLGGGDGSAGQQTLTWSGLDLPEGSTFTIQYDVEILGSVLPGQTLSNRVAVAWSSLDGEIEGERTYTATATAPPLAVQSAGVLGKGTTQPSAAIGEEFRYLVTVPQTPMPMALNDVRIYDNLPASAADLRFVRAEIVSPSAGPLAASVDPVTGVVELVNLDGSGLDIAPNGQIEVAVTVVLLDTEKNRTPSLSFTNRAWYTCSSGAATVGSDATTGATSERMTVAHPTLTLTKTGPDPATMRVGAPAAFTLDLQNTGDSTAWNVTVTDWLPNPTPGGMCDAGVSGVSVTLHQNDGTTQPLNAGEHYDTTFAISSGAPRCEFVLTTKAPVAVAPGERLVVTYSAALDADTLHGSTLTNVAGATAWLSGDPAGVYHTYVAPLTDGTVGLLDHQDAYTVSVQGAVLAARKTVENVTTGEGGANATPGDRLRYTITIDNTTDIPLGSFSLRDALERLNAAPMFQPGTIGNVSVPAGAVYAVDGSTLTVDDLDIEANGTLIVAFEAVLAPVITSGTVVLNQGELVLGGTVFARTDDPALPGEDDPTRTLIASAPAFEVWKTSDDLTGDPAVLLAGETLRYTLTVRNIGTEDAVDMRLRDDIPANTTYVANSTTLNGSPVADPSVGVSPLLTGLPINAPENSTSGYLRADATPGGTNLATVTFDVVVDPTVMDGLIIANQGFVDGSGAGSGPQPEQPSDDPATPVLLDPTRDIVGNLPLLGARKTVQIYQDLGSPGIADPEDVLRYTIVIGNGAATPATGVVFSDAVPANTTYVADSLRLNGEAVGPDGGVSPLVAGLAVQSSDLPGTGIISAGGSAVLTFEVRIDDGVPAGTVISNQGSVASAELPPEPTDADGLPSNGHQPTVIVVGDAQLLAMTKEVLVVGGGTALAGGELEYVLRVSNAGTVPATRVVVTDDLGPLGSQVSYVPGSGTLNGLAAGVSFAGAVLTVDYAALYGDLPPGEGIVVRFRVRIDPALPAGTTFANTGVVRWNDPPQSAAATVALDLGGTPGSAAVNGSVWHDADLDRQNNGAERPLEGWSVALYRGNRLLASVDTDPAGGWRLSGLVPNEGGEPYEIRFVAPGAGPDTATLGHADSPFTDGPQRISGITAASGENLQGLNLPISPNGAVYNAVARTPVAGARLALRDAATEAPLPEQCFDDPAQQDQVTARDGFYKFDLNFSDPACRPGGAYFIAVTPPASGYLAAPSRIIPPNGDPAAPFSVPACLGTADDAVPASADYCEAVPSASVPPTSVAPRTAGTVYHLNLVLDDGRIPGESQIFNNHLPLDPQMAEAVAITKTAALRNVSKGQLVPYTITVNNIFGVPLYDVAVVDRFPAGFKYLEGSARIDGAAREPRIAGRELLWDLPVMEVDATQTIQLLLVVGAGVGEGEYVNRAQVLNAITGGAVSGEATATVRVVPDPTFDCTDVIGKVFDDRNLNGVQDAGEEGLAGSRVVTARGLIATADAHGRFHLTCAVVPDEDRGSNFILKLDDRSLPTGYRVTTENPRVQRATRGKMLRFNFGATIHRVVAIDLADGAFEPETTRLRLQWEARIGELLEELKKGPAVLRLSYLADVERESLVRERLGAMKKEIVRQWKSAGGNYRLDIETETFWRRGAPAER